MLSTHAPHRPENRLGIAGGPSATAVALPRRPSLSAAEVADAARCLEGACAAEIIGWAVERFGRRLVLATSFADALLVDLAVAVDPDIRVVTLDTGFLFAETHETMRRAMGRYALDLTVLRPAADARDVWAHGTEACCVDRKSGPLDDFLATAADAWLSGLRRCDDPGRARTPVVEMDRRGLVKINPIAAWNDAQVDAHIVEYGVPVNALAFEGYGSIGCWPCTEPGVGRSGRWAGSGRSECGLHA